jgi:hypothetical protein
MAQHQERETARIEAFSDGVFAFAATLLVVSLEVPRTIPGLLAELKGFIAFAVSFAALALIWSVHHAFFRRYGRHDRTTVFINACLLFVVLFYVYPLKFLAGGLVGTLVGMEAGAVSIGSIDELSLLFMLYSVGFVAVFACISLLYRHAWRTSAGTAGASSDPTLARFYFRHYLIFVGVGVLATALAWWKVGLTFGLPALIYVLLGPLCYLHGVRSGRRT